VLLERASDGKFAWAKLACKAFPVAIMFVQIASS